MKNLILLLISLLISFLTWTIYNQTRDWQFFIAFMGGGIDAYLLYTLMDKEK